MIQPSSKIYISKSLIPNAGRGVFASTVIKKNEVIELCPIIIVPHSEIRFLQQTLLINYYFEWGYDLAICFGYGALYNHSYSPNALYKKHLDHAYIEFIAYENISKDEEIIVNYNHGNPDDKSTLWMKDVPVFKE